MIKLGRRIYYDKATGNIITDTFDQLIVEGGIEPSVENDITTFTALSERNRDTFDVLELPFGAYAQEFAESIGYRVNVESKELEFSYLDPNEPEVEQPYVPPLSESITQLADENAELMFQNAMQDMSISTLQDENSELMFRLATLEMGAI